MKAKRVIHIYCPKMLQSIAKWFSSNGKRLWDILPVPAH